MKKFLTVMFSLFAVLLFAPQINGFGPEPVLLVLFALAAVLIRSNDTPSSSKVHTAGIQVEQWVKYIIERLWKDNQFLNFAWSDDDKVVGGRIVHIPQPGAAPAVVKNRSSYPAVAVRRTDTDILYALDEYTTEPTHLPDADKKDLSYNKMDSILGDHMGILNQTIADDILIKWAPPASAFVRTSGAATAALGTGQTGNRLAFRHLDLKKAGSVMRKQNILKTEWYCMMEENMYDQFTDSLSDTQNRDFSQYLNAETGVVGKLHNFNIMTRTSVLNYASDDTIKALGAAGAATDNLACLCWQKNSVARAKGEVSVFSRLNDPLYYGDIYSALVRMGGRIRRADNAGIVAIVQAPSA